MLLCGPKFGLVDVPRAAERITSTGAADRIDALVAQGHKVKLVEGTAEE